MKNNIKAQKGITLIALVITIVVMLILAGISINLIIGENGIFTKTKEAREKFEIASVKEQISQDLLSAELSSTISGGGLTNIQIASEFTKYGTLIYGEGADSNKVVGVTLEDGTTINLVDIWAGSQSTLADLSKVTFIKDTDGNVVPVPNGFYYVGGTVDTGVVISDVEADKYDGTIDKTAHSYNTSLQGNQFVWVPVTGGIENARSDFGVNKNSIANFATCTDVLESNYLTTTNNTAGAVLSHETGETIDLYKEMQTSVNNYEGFYVARYEASSSNDTTEGSILSKPSGKPWDKINQPNAMAKCEMMYSGSSSVKSLLMSSYTWDATLSFIQNRGDKKDVSGDSTLWGNYSNRRSATNIITFKGDYINSVFNPTIGTFTGTWISPLNEMNSLGMSNYLKLATGIAESTKSNNLYDIAGNVWEWTTEITGNGVSKNRIFRGGSFFHRGDCVASYRYGAYTSFNINVDVRFPPSAFHSNVTL